VRQSVGLCGGLAAVSLALFFACSDQSSPAPAPADGGAGACVACVTDQDCNGGTCTQLGSDSYCAAACPNGNECDADHACVPASSVTGQQVSVCVPRAADDACGSVGTDSDAGAPPPTDTCGPLDGPNVKSTCTSCAGKSTCQTNGCYGGWWCNRTTNRCQSPPTDCGSSGGPLDAGPPVMGTVGANGGSLSRLLFAVVGDTRPASIDDTPGYPTAVIDKIFSDVEAFAPRPAFVVSTGDYMFASTFGTQAGAQLDLYLGARAKYSQAVFPAMGNHECTGATASNCGPGATNGETNNYQAFLSKMLGPIQKTSPYYEIDVDALDKSWNAKLVFVAANAWDDAQATWLETTLAKSTTYTFVIRHESRQANTAPGVTPSEAIMAKHPYTLAIVGHTHTYEHYTGSREVIIGNGGAPATGSKNYGFALLNQRSDGAIEVDMIDYASGLSDARFRFAVHPDGSSAP